MKKAIVVTLFSIDMDRADEIEDLAIRMGQAMQRRGIDAILKVEEVSIPDPKPAVPTAEVN